MLAKRKKRGTRRLESEELVEAGPLLPGQSRIRRAAHPKNVREIRGDSESEESENEQKSPSPQFIYNGDIRDFLDHEAPPENTWSTQPEDEVQMTGYSHPGNRPRIIRQSSVPVPEVVEISDEESTSSSEEEQVDEDDIQTLLGDDDGGIIYDIDTRGGNVKEESLIDWMLSRTRIVGSTISKPKTGNRKSRSRKIGQARSGGGGATRSKYKIDVTTHGARKLGNERQTLLSFENHATTKSSRSKSDGPKGMTLSLPSSAWSDHSVPPKNSWDGD
jgi:hypothetical protein